MTNRKPFETVIETGTPCPRCRVRCYTLFDGVCWRCSSADAERAAAKRARRRARRDEWQEVKGLYYATIGLGLFAALAMATFGH